MTSANLILDRYKPLGTAGAGGFGTVQIAWDPRIQRKVAIKTIQLSEADVRRAALPGANAPVVAREDADQAGGGRWRGVQPWGEYLAQVDAQEADSSSGPRAQAGTVAPEPVTALAHLPGLDEARTAAKLSDQRIVTVFDFEVRGRTAYLIMEYVEGVTLARLLSEHGDELTLDMVAAVFDAIAGALTVAHKAGVLHLDIKPDNIIINPQGEAKVTDFGLATLADASGAGTTGGGTIGYMPLEQMRREPLDARTDEWSLAALTYEMLTGENPFRVSTLAEAERAIEDAELVLPSLCWDDVDAQVDDVIFYALDPDPAERYATVAHFAEEMDKFLGDADKGKRQLAALLGGKLDDEPEDDDEPDGEDGPEMGEEGGALGVFAADRPRFGVAAEIPERWLAVGGRVFGAVASGVATWVAAQSLPLAAVVGAAGVTYAAAIATLVVAAVGAIRSHAGALMAFVLCGAAAIAAGRPVEGVVLAVLAVAWWYTIARHGTAAANTALMLPLVNLAGPGAAAAVPLVAGAALRPIEAVATTVFAAAAWIALGAAPVTVLETWTTIGGWLVASLVLALLSMRGRHWLTVAGLGVAVAAVAVGSIVFAPITPQLVVALVASAAAVIILR